MAKKTAQNDAFQELKAAIRSKDLGRLYIFHGEETFLMDHYFGQMKKILLDDLTESFNFHKLNNETFDLQTFGDSVENMPMMAEHTLVHVDEIDLFKLPEGERSKMAELLSDIPEWCTVVFTYETVSWKPDKRLKKLWEAIDNNASIVEFAKQGQRELISWVSRHFAARGKRISNELCAYLIDITGGTMTALNGEISKIAAFSGADEIKRSDIDAVTEPVMDAVVFQMTDLMGEGKYGPALVKLQTLLKMQQEPLAILGAVGGHFRRLSTARTLLDNGKGSGELMKLCGIADYPARKSMDAARRFRPEFCRTAAELVLETDYKMKTSYDDPERLLEMLILELAQEARRG
ncbi:MAG: DNA polymerase III subunit delta [Oscillospiraceae bacterium]|nr:DNA polymerase III subunit delta [Oscillospiraceae bacterium]